MAQIPLPSLLLDDKNPRLQTSDQPRSQLEILRELTLSDEHSDKIVALAKDIAHHGLDPSSLVCVYKRDPKSKQYVVLEGNRRVAALKLLLNPDIISGLTSSTRFKEIKKLSERFSLPPTVNCIVFDSEEQADHWIALKHTGQHGGAGMVSWGAVETLRFSHRNSQKPIELQLIDFAASHILDFDPASVKITNLERLTSDPVVREALGIEIINSTVHVDRRLSDFALIISALLKCITAEGFTVNVIKTKTDRQRFIDKFVVDHAEHFAIAPRDLNNRYPISGKGPVTSTKNLNPKTVKTVVRTSLHKAVLTPIAGDGRYSSKTKALAKELKDFGFEKSPIGAIYLIRAFLENIIIEANSTLEGQRQTTSLKASLKAIVMEAELEGNNLVRQSADILLDSPIVAKKAFDYMLGMSRSDRIEHMNQIISAVGVIIGNFNKNDRALEVAIV